MIKEIDIEDFSKKIKNIDKEFLEKFSKIGLSGANKEEKQEIIHELKSMKLDFILIDTKEKEFPVNFPDSKEKKKRLIEVCENIDALVVLFGNNNIDLILDCIHMDIMRCIYQIEILGAVLGKFKYKNALEINKDVFFEHAISFGIDELVQHIKKFIEFQKQNNREEEKSNFFL